MALLLDSISRSTSRVLSPSNAMRSSRPPNPASNATRIGERTRSFGATDSLYRARHNTLFSSLSLSGGSARSGRLASAFGVGQPAAAEDVLGDARQVRLDVQDGGSVQHVDAPDPQKPSLAAQELDHGQTDGIGPPRRARREDAMRPAIVGGRRGHQIEAIGPIEFPQHEEMGEPFDVGEAGLERFLDFQGPERLVPRAETLGHLPGLRIRRPRVPDGAGDEHKLYFTSAETNQGCL